VDGERRAKEFVTAKPPGLDDRQTRVFEALTERNQKLAGLYRAALANLEAQAAPGEDAARVSIVCHCMRELMNGLPSAMSDSSFPRPKPAATTLMRQLPDLFERHPEIDLDAEQDLVPVPRLVARQLATLMRTVAQEQGRNIRNAAALLTGNPGTRHPVLAQWSDAQKFFLHWTHLDRNQDEDRDLPSDDTIAAHIKVVEDVIEVRTAMFFENLRSIEDILKAANMVEGEQN
jgi:hypothetical protein